MSHVANNLEHGYVMQMGRLVYSLCQSPSKCDLRGKYGPSIIFMRSQIDLDKLAAPLDALERFLFKSLW